MDFTTALTVRVWLAENEGFSKVADTEPSLGVAAVAIWLGKPARLAQKTNPARDSRWKLFINRTS
ncbi:hypothetical protein FMN52_03290 [Marinobacter sp. BW6]|uniref:hypothetical protein n=1 Tax=Marinobacter sp. BW6 TaxID=2592624 RepID=UPI0011DEAFC8|nr:hypothetical protein [Marinobacter sp. BW6]TYC62791.1 hypothetical protein FMN52_03290 [Marinobacter sp. BW6]